MGFVTFTVLSLVGLGITWIVMLLAHDWAGLPVEVAKFMAVGLAFTWNFLSRKYLLFRAERPILYSNNLAMGNSKPGNMRGKVKTSPL